MQNGILSEKKHWLCDRDSILVKSACNKTLPPLHFKISLITWLQANMHESLCISVIKS